MPVPSNAFEAKVFVRREVALLQSQGDDEQHQRTQEHMEAVETCEHKEC